MQVRWRNHVHGRRAAHAGAADPLAELLDGPHGQRATPGPGGGLRADRDGEHQAADAARVLRARPSTRAAARTWCWGAGGVGVARLSQHVTGSRLLKVHNVFQSEWFGKASAASSVSCPPRRNQPRRTGGPDNNQELDPCLLADRLCRGDLTLREVLAENHRANRLGASERTYTYPSSDVVPGKSVTRYSCSVCQSRVFVK